MQHAGFHMGFPIGHNLRCRYLLTEEPGHVVRPTMRSARLNSSDAFGAASR